MQNGNIDQTNLFFSLHEFLKDLSEYEIAVRMIN